MFDSIAGTPTYVSSSLINVVVPYEIAGRTTTNVTVVYQGISSAAIPQQVAAAAPGIFTLPGIGNQAVALDVNGAMNGSWNGLAGTGYGLVTLEPVAEGAYLSVYLTGLGVTSPATATGSVNSSTTLLNVAGVTATIGGVPAKVTFAGSAPALLDGVYQVVLQVPTGVSGNSLPLIVTVNGISSPSGAATVAVQ